MAGAARVGTYLRNDAQWALDARDKDGVSQVKPRATITVQIALGAAAGLLFGWQSLMTPGRSVVVVSVLPCLVMWALGICVSRAGRKHGSQVE